MSIIHLPNGLGADTGDTVATSKPLEMSGNVWYVNSAIGTDAASPAGQNRTAPLATLEQAQTNAADGDIVVLADGHAETYTATLILSKNLTIVAGGRRSNGRPTVKFTNDQSNSSLWEVDTAYLQVFNIWFEENQQASTSHLVNVIGESALLFRMRGCYFECGQYDNAAALKLDAAYSLIYTTTFISTSTTIATQPHSAIEAAGNVEVLILEGVVLNAGTVGFSNYAALDFFAGGGPANNFIENLSLLNGADARLEEATEGYINAATSSGGARIDWCDESGV